MAAWINSRAISCSSKTFVNLTPNGLLQGLTRKEVQSVSEHNGDPQNEERPGIYH
jgi:hypothetical protein